MKKLSKKGKKVKAIFSFTFSLILTLVYMKMTPEKSGEFIKQQHKIIEVSTFGIVISLMCFLENI